MQQHKTRTIDIEKLNPAPYNPRKDLKPTDPEYQQIARSLTEHGVVEYPVWNERTGHLVGGHQRVKVMREAGLKRISVVVVDLTLDDEKILNIALNKISGAWDQSALVKALEELRTKGRIESTGFNTAQLEQLKREQGARTTRNNKDPDASPALQQTAVSRRGDLYELGAHRILCGDARDAGDVDRLMDLPLEAAALIFTDPPYGVDYTSVNDVKRVNEGKAANHTKIASDADEHDALVQFLAPAFKLMAAHAAPAAAFYIWHASASREDFLHAMKLADIAEIQPIIWMKPWLVLGHADYQWQHEPCFYARAGAERPKWYGDRTQTTAWLVTPTTGSKEAMMLGNGVTISDGQGDEIFITSKPPKGKRRTVRLGVGQFQAIVRAVGDDGDVWQISRDTVNAQHPTQKPVELATRAMHNSSQAGDIVLDTFLGSGSTLIAAETMGRRCFGMELEPRYVDVAVRRWQEFTGKKAKLSRATPPQRQPAPPAKASRTKRGSKK